VKWNLLHYGPGFRAIVFPRRLLRSCIVATVHAWDIPKDLRERLQGYWAGGEVVQAGTHAV